jgi:hypothetical protein
MRGRREKRVCKGRGKREEGRGKKREDGRRKREG